MNQPGGAQATGPERDFIGYGRFPPAVRWPDDAGVVVSVVLNYEAGSEYSYLDDGRNDSWGEHSDQVGPQGARPRHRDPLRVR